MTSQDKNGYAVLNPNTKEAESGAPKPPAKVAGAASIFKMVFLGTKLNVLLPLVPLGILAPRLGWSEEAIFALNFCAILPLAKILGFATEELATKVGETWGGLLNATFGNAVEMILSIFALQKNLVSVVQGSLLGSILSNLLLVLGMCFFFGGIKFHAQKYNADGARVQSNLLLLSVLALSIPSLVAIAESKHSEYIVLNMSRGAAVVLTCLYAMYLVFQLRTHTDYFQGAGEEESDDEEHLHPGVAGALLLVVTLIVALCSEGLVDSVEGITESLGISQQFIGTILLPIVGNAAEHLTAVEVAMKNKMDLSINVALGSSSQIALFVVPFTVCAGWAMGVPMDLNFQPLGTGILLMTVLIVGALTSDGESNWLEGAMLIAAYLLISITFWVM